MSNEIDKYDVVASMLAAVKAELNSTIETQTLMQLLVKKGVLTTQEIKRTREIVKQRSPRVQMLMKEFSSLDLVLTLFEKSDEEKRRFMFLLDKMMTDRDSLTEEEIDYLDSKLDFKKYWEEDSK